MATMQWQTPRERAAELERLSDEALKETRAIDSLQAAVRLIKQYHNNMIDVLTQAFPLMPTVQQQLQNYKIP